MKHLPLRFQVGAALIAGVIAGTGCQSVQTTGPGAIGVERRQHMSPLVSEADLRAGAATAYAKLIDDARTKGALNRQPAVAQQIRDIGARLIRETASFRADAPSWPWEINVVTSPDVNAWCMPGGKIAVYTGLLEKIRPTTAELAAVIGHEIAHALREHARERASSAVTQGLLIDIVGAAAGAKAGNVDLARLALEVTLNLPNSREQEDEADRIGVELAARAGYEPHAAVSLWEKMMQAGGGAAPEFLSTHPSPASRIRDVQRYADQVSDLYRLRQRPPDAGSGPPAQR